MLKIGIDLDNTIDSTVNSIAFFSLITSLLKGNAEVHIITNRNPMHRKETIEDLRVLGITYDYLELTANKSKYILDKGIGIYFDDTDEYFLDLPESVVVFKIREDGNFDFSDKKWFYGKDTGKL